MSHRPLIAVLMRKLGPSHPIPGSETRSVVGYIMSAVGLTGKMHQLLHMYM